MEKISNGYLLWVGAFRNGRWMVKVFGKLMLALGHEWWKFIEQKILNKIYHLQS